MCLPSSLSFASRARTRKEYGGREARAGSSSSSPSSSRYANGFSPIWSIRGRTCLCFFCFFQFAARTHTTTPLRPKPFDREGWRGVKKGEHALAWRARLEGQGRTRTRCSVRRAAFDRRTQPCAAVRISESLGFFSLAGHATHHALSLSRDHLFPSGLGDTLILETRRAYKRERRGIPWVERSSRCVGRRRKQETTITTNPTAIARLAFEPHTPKLVPGEKERRSQRAHTRNLPSSGLQPSWSTRLL